jgi:peptide deformylase
MENQKENLKIFTYPDAVLQSRASEVENIDEELLDLADGMLHTMYAAPGIGLAANQVGDLSRLIVFERNPKGERRDPCVLLNPEIVEREGEIVYEEACLSVVDFSAEVARSAKVLVRGLDRHGNPMDIEGEGLLAICLQHEIDHLDGILYIDHISSLKRAMYKKRLTKMLKKE